MQSQGRADAEDRLEARRKGSRNVCQNSLRADGWWHSHSHDREVHLARRWRIQVNQILENCFKKSEFDRNSLERKIIVKRVPRGLPKIEFLIRVCVCALKIIPKVRSALELFNKAFFLHLWSKNLEKILYRILTHKWVLYSIFGDILD